MTTLVQRIEQKDVTIGVVGLGYVGLPVACLFADAGFQTIGVDINAERVAALQVGNNPIEGKEPGIADLIQRVVERDCLHPTTDYAALVDADVITVSVQTPIEDSDHKPRYDHLRSALRSLGAVLASGALVIIESTLAPGTMQSIVIPTLEAASGGTAGTDFYVGHCPERVTPGRLLRNLRTMNRVVGGMSSDVTRAMIALYTHIVEGDLDGTDMLTAEIVKTAENAYRDVQIAFANELARVCESLGGDVWQVRDLVNKVPGRNVLYPGAGVGGHCIPKDPWLLIANSNVDTALIPAARQVNRAMPAHVLSMIKQALIGRGKSLSEACVAILGYAYMENSDDTRDTPSQALIDLLESQGATYRIHDPYVDAYQGELDDVLQNADVAVLLVKHDDYQTVDWQAALDTMQTPIVVDTRAILPDDFAPATGDVWRLGRGLMTTQGTE